MVKIIKRVVGETRMMNKYYCPCCDARFKDRRTMLHHDYSSFQCSGCREILCQQYENKKFDSVCLDYENKKFDSVCLDCMKG